MKIAELRELKIDELHTELDRLRHHLFNLRSQAVTEKLEDSSQLTKTKRDIARVLTLMTELGEKDVEQKQYHMESIGGPKKKKA